jgi:hypothetical protein
MRPMDTAMIDAHLENIDRRLTNLEQILPTLATKEELTALATKADLTALAAKEALRLAVESLATKEELRLAIEPLATKEELRLAIEPLATKGELREGFERVRQHLTILIEHQDDKIQLLIDHVQSLRPRRSGE